MNLIGTTLEDCGWDQGSARFRSGRAITRSGPLGSVQRRIENTKSLIRSAVTSQNPSVTETMAPGAILALDHLEGTENVFQCAMSNLDEYEDVAGRSYRKGGNFPHRGRNDRIVLPLVDE